MNLTAIIAGLKTAQKVIEKSLRWEYPRAKKREERRIKERENK